MRREDSVESRHLQFPRRNPSVLEAAGWRHKPATRPPIRSLSGQAAPKAI